MLVIGGGIAAYKTLDLIRRLRDMQACVRAILTDGGAQFITPLSVASLTGEKVYTDLFSLTDETEMGHIRLSRDADLVLVAPATANLIAKIASGRADDLASTTLLAANKPVMVCPSMNVEMWLKPSTRRNILQLEADGITVIGPAEGDLACGEFGEGRLAEINDILLAVERSLGLGNLPLNGRRALVTAGPTHEAIDPVRYIANRSSGKQGYAISGALHRLGAETLLISGPTNLGTPEGVKRVDITSADEMLEAAEAALPVDVAICVAAVSDWKPKHLSCQKIKKGSKPMQIDLLENPDILRQLSRARNNRPNLVIGFAAETNQILENARAKLLAKKCNWIVANDVSPETGILGGDQTEVHLLTSDKVESWPVMSKQKMAARLAESVAEYFTLQAS